MSNQRIIFSGMQILLEKKWEKNQAVIVENSQIKAIIPENMIEHHLPATKYSFHEDHYLIPGFIDLHTHGANGKDVMDGDVESLKVIARALAAEGVTGFLATTMTASKERIEKVLTVIPEAMSFDEGAAILGINLEGPFISNKKMGAHQHGEEIEPDIKLLEYWQELASGAIKIITLAPELVNALKFITEVSKKDIILSIGHTDATYEETCAAIQAGCSHATHLFNAMSGIHQRKPGAVSALLLSDKVSTELIVDGIHLHPAIVDLSLRLKNKEMIVLVTDAMRAKCLRNGQFELGGQTVHVSNGKATLADGTLAGSTLKMPQAIKNMMAFTHCSLIDAIQMATENPARLLGLDNRKASITVGKDADLVVLNPNLEVKLTMRAGKEVFSSD